MMKRLHVDELYSAYLEGGLPELTRREVDTHLQECAQCREGLKDMQQMIVDLGSLPVSEPPAGFVSGVRARIAEKPLAKRQWWVIPVWSVGSFAAAAALLIAILSASRTSNTMVATAPPQAATAQRQTYLPKATTTPTDDLLGAQTPATQTDRNPRSTVEARERAKTMKTLGGSAMASRPTQAQEHEPPLTIALAPRQIIPEQMGKVESRDAMADAPSRLDGLITKSAQNSPDNLLTTDSYADKASPRFDQSTRVAADSAPVMAKAMPVGAAVLKGSPTFNSAVSFENPTQTLDAVQALDQPKTGQHILLHIAGTQGTVVVSYMPPALPVGPLEAVPASKELIVPVVDNQVKLDASVFPQGSIVTLDLGGKQSYLFVPEAQARQERVTIKAEKQARKNVLQQLANYGGMYLLSPAEFADIPITFTAINVSPLSALNQLVEQAK